MDDRKKRLEDVKEAVVEALHELHDQLCPHHGKLTNSGSKGPSQVATKEYRDHFDAIFGKRPDVGEA